MGLALHRANHAVLPVCPVGSSMPCVQAQIRVTADGLGPVAVHALGGRLRGANGTEVSEIFLVPGPANATDTADTDEPAAHEGVVWLEAIEPGMIEVIAISASEISDPVTVLAAAPPVYLPGGLSLVEGQEATLHVQSDATRVECWAEQATVPSAFSILGPNGLSLFSGPTDLGDARDIHVSAVHSGATSRTAVVRCSDGVNPVVDASIAVMPGTAPVGSVSGLTISPQSVVFAQNQTAELTVSFTAEEEESSLLVTYTGPLAVSQGALTVVGSGFTERRLTVSATGAGQGEVCLQAEGAALLCRAVTVFGPPRFLAPTNAEGSVALGSAPVQIQVESDAPDPPRCWASTTGASSVSFESDGDELLENVVEVGPEQPIIARVVASTASPTASTLFCSDNANQTSTLAFTTSPTSGPTLTPNALTLIEDQPRTVDVQVAGPPVTCWVDTATPTSFAVLAPSGADLFAAPVTLTSDAALGVTALATGVSARTATILCADGSTGNAQAALTIPAGTAPLGTVRDLVARAEPAVLSLGETGELVVTAEPEEEEVSLLVFATGSVSVPNSPLVIEGLFPAERRVVVQASQIAGGGEVCVRDEAQHEQCGTFTVIAPPEYLAPTNPQGTVDLSTSPVVVQVVSGAPEPPLCWATVSSGVISFVPSGGTSLIAEVTPVAAGQPVTVTVEDPATAANGELYCRDQAGVERMLSFAYTP